MKRTVQLACMLLFTGGFMSCNRVPEGAKTVTFKVWGNCGMCEKTIESSLKTEGIIAASWNKDTKIIEVSYDTTATNLSDIQKQIAAVGYDNDGYTGDSLAYSSLHKCCKYKRK